MPGIARHPLPARADRDLTRVPAYANVLNALHNLRDSYQVLALYQEVFGEDMLGTGWDDLLLEATFIGRVADELFPIDMIVVGDLMYTWEDGPINSPIPVAGLRLPWEVAADEDLLPWQRAVAAAIAENYVTGEEWDMAPLPPDPLLGITWLAGDEDEVATALAQLSSRGEPWDGLADLVRVTTQPVTGNPFLDWPDDFSLAPEYVYHDFYWTAADIEYLAHQYDGVRPIADRIRAFENWYNAQPDWDVADQIVIAKLREAGGD